VALRSASGRTVLKGGEVEFEWAAGLQLSGRGVEIPVLTPSDLEPVSGIEPLTCRLQEARPDAPGALPAQMARSHAADDANRTV